MSALFVLCEFCGDVFVVACVFNRFLKKEHKETSNIFSRIIEECPNIDWLRWYISRDSNVAGLCYSNFLLSIEDKYWKRMKPQLLRLDPIFGTHIPTKHLKPL